MGKKIYLTSHNKNADSGTWHGSIGGPTDRYEKAVLVGGLRKEIAKAIEFRFGGHHNAVALLRDIMRLMGEES